MGYHRAGFEVVGVDIAPQPHYPFEFHQADAMTFPLEGFDAIHASPPCQRWTAYRRRGGGVGEGYPELVVPMRERLQRHGVAWVIENVPGAPLVPTVVLCGSMFGLDVRRHRLFESTELMLQPSCDHTVWEPRRFPGGRSGMTGNPRAKVRATVEVGRWNISLAVQQQAMGIDWMTLPELSEAIPPAYTEYIGARLMEVLL